MSREANFDAIEKGYYKVMVDGAEVSQRSKPLKAISDALAEKVNNENADVYIMQPNIEVVASVKCETITEPIEPQILKAFPSAYGAGAYTTGGRGGEVLHVTNLNDSGEGSLRWALTQTYPRIIIFDVSGVININKLLYVSSENSNFTLAGQSSPSGGITVAGGRVYFSGVTNYIMRHIRFKGGFQADTIPNRPELGIGSASFSGVGSQKDIIVDHVSFGFGDTMPTWTKQGDKEGIVDKVSIVNCLFAESNKGAIIGQDVDQDTYYLSGDITFSRNIFYNTRYRTPNTTGNHEGDNSFDIINNLTWNAQGRIIRGSGNANINHIGNATYQGVMPLNDVNLNLYSKGWNPKIYTKGNKIYAPNVADVTYSLEEMNNDNTLSWKVFNYGGEDYGNQLPTSFFVNESFSIKGESIETLNADDLRSNLPTDNGCNARLNEDGSVSSNLDVHDDKYLENILNDVMPMPIDSNNYAIEPIQSNLRPSNYYVSNPHIPEVWFNNNVPSGKSHNDTNEIGYTYLELFLNQVDK